MPKDAARYVSSSRAARKSRVRPIPDFSKLHQQLEKQTERRKAFARSTVPEEFDLTKSDRKVSKSATYTEQKSSSIVTRSMVESATHPSILRQQKAPASDEFNFKCDDNSLQGILTNTGITMPPPTDPSARTKTVSFMTSSNQLTGTLQAPSPSLAIRGYWVKDRSSIYDKWVPAVCNSVRKVSSAVKCGRAGRVPLGYPAASLVQHSTAPSPDSIARRTRSRFDVHLDKESSQQQTPIGDDVMAIGTAHSSISSVRFADLTKTASRIPRSRSASKPRAARQLLAETISVNTSTPQDTETRSESLKKKETNIVSTIVFDDVEALGRQSVQDSVNLRGSESAKKTTSGSRRRRRSSTTDGIRRPQLDVFYQDLDHGVHSSPSSPWRDNIISSGPGGNTRSPLSVISRQPNKQNGSQRSDTRKPRGQYLAAAKEAIAEMWAMEKRLNKENVSSVLACRTAHSSYIDSVRQHAVTKPVSTESLGTRLMPSEEIVDDISSVLEKRVVVNLEESNDEFENKENLIMDNNEENVNQLLTESNQLQKKARKLRRRSQLTHDASEQAHLARQVEIIQQRMRELNAILLDLKSKLHPCDDKIMRVEVMARDKKTSDQPLNLKVSENLPALNGTSRGVFLDEPLNLKVSASGSTDDVTYFCVQNGRKVLADITEQVVGELTDDDYFEVPDSPEPIDDIKEEESLLHDAQVLKAQPLDLCIVKRTTFTDSESTFTVAKTTPVKGLPEYLASLNLSTISEVTNTSPHTGEQCNTSVSSSSGSPLSPDMSSEFIGYRKYCRQLIDEDVARCGDPVAMMLFEGDEQHFLPISGASPMSG